MPGCRVNLAPPWSYAHCTLLEHGGEEAAKGWEDSPAGPEKNFASLVAGVLANLHLFLYGETNLYLEMTLYTHSTLHL